MSIDQMIEKTNVDGARTGVLPGTPAGVKSFAVVLFVPILILTYLLVLGSGCSAYSDTGFWCEVVSPAIGISWTAFWFFLFAIIARRKEGKDVKTLLAVYFSWFFLLALFVAIFAL